MRKFIRSFDLPCYDSPPEIIVKNIYKIISIDDIGLIKQLEDRKYRYKYPYEQELVLYDILINGGCRHMYTNYNGVDHLNPDIKSNVNVLINELEKYNTEYIQLNEEHKNNCLININQIYEKYNLCNECEGRGRFYEIKYGEYEDDDHYNEYICTKCNGTGDYT